MPAIDASIEKFSKAGNVAKATKWKGVREALVKERRALSQEGFRLGLNPDLDAELKDLEQQMLKVQGDIEAVQKREPQKILDGLKKKNPKALYAIEGFDTFVKAWVAKAAWNEFVMSAGEPPAESAKKAADATFRTLDCTGTIFKSSGIEKLLQWGWKDRLGVSTEEAAKIFGKWGTGLGALADIGAASVYTYDVFYSQAYASKLDETYLPSDALAIHAWHLVIWEGKWIVAIGSTSGFLGAGPFGTRLQAIGYLFQLVGEVGEAFAKFGKVEKRHYVDVLLQMRLWAMNARARLKDNGCDMDFYPDSTHQKMRDCIDKFTWWPVSPTEYRAVFGLANLPAGKAG